MSEDELASWGIDTSVPNIARVYNLMLGGKDHFAADRQVAELALQIAPDAPKTARANRLFLKRVVGYLAAQAGIRQFLDIGSGLPSYGNVHEIAQEVDGEIRVVYVDNDPVVLTHGHAMLATNTHTTVVQADIRRPEDIISNPVVREFIDFSQPVLLLLAILHHLNDQEDPAGIAARLRGELPHGSYVAISHFLNPGQEHPEEAERAARAEKLFNENLGTGRWRTREEILAFFGDLDLLEPGLVPLPLWRPPGQPDGIPLLGQGAELDPIHYSFVGGLARKA